MNTGCGILKKNVEPNRHLYTMFKHVFLADDKMANISLDVHTFIAQKSPQNVVSNPHLTTPWRKEHFPWLHFFSLKAYPLSSFKPVIFVIFE